MNKAEQIKAQENHNKIREVLESYGNEEQGDCIVDEICFIFGAPTTTDIADEEGNLHPQSYYKEE